MSPGTRIRAPWAAAATLLAVAGCARGPVWTQAWSIPNGQRAAYSAAGLDLNGDGVGDLLVGRPGGAEAYFGSKQGPSLKPDWVFEDHEPGSTGYCVGSAGHLCDDPHPVFFVSAPRVHGRGVVYLFKTGPHGPEAKPWKVLESPSKGEGFGERVVRAGDLFGDGYDDLAVADFAWGEQRGKVYVFRGGPDGPGPKPVWEAGGTSVGEWFGYSLCAPGDLDGDGLADLVVGSKNCNGSCLTWLQGNPGFDLHRDYLNSPAWSKAAQLPMTGRLSVFYGSKHGLSLKPDLIMEGDSDHELFAYALAAPGDVDGSGHADLLVGSIGWRSRRGVTELYAGGPKGVPLRRIWKEVGSVADEGFGYGLAAIPRLGGKGVPGVLLGGTEADSAWVAWPFVPPFDLRRRHLLDGPPTHKRLTDVLGDAGDLWGDGRDAVYVLCPGMEGHLYVERLLGDQP